MSLLSVVLGYVLGSLPFGWLAARRWGGIDLRRVGSGNPGAANAFRASGMRVALSVVALDVTKGVASVLVARRLAEGPGVSTAAGVAATLGHIYPLWLGFRGGKGVATACGAFAVLSPVATILSAAVFLATVGCTRYVSLGSVLATASMGPFAYWCGAPGPVVVGALLTAAIVVERHRTNLARLQAGTERRIGQRVA